MADDKQLLEDDNDDIGMMLDTGSEMVEDLAGTRRGTLSTFFMNLCSFFLKCLILFLFQWFR